MDLSSIPPTTQSTMLFLVRHDSVLFHAERSFPIDSGLDSDALMAKQQSVVCVGRARDHLPGPGL